jgi:hypothetical protein
MLSVGEPKAKATDSADAVLGRDIVPNVLAMSFGSSDKTKTNER